MLDPLMVNLCPGPSISLSITFSKLCCSLGLVLPNLLLPCLVSLITHLLWSERCQSCFFCPRSITYVCPSESYAFLITLASDSQRTWTEVGGLVTWYLIITAQSPTVLGGQPETLQRDRMAWPSCKNPRVCTYFPYIEKIGGFLMFLCIASPTWSLPIA